MTATAAGTLHVWVRGAHARRVRAHSAPLLSLSALTSAAARPGGGSAEPFDLAVGTADGSIQLWRVDALDGAARAPADSGARAAGAEADADADADGAGGAVAPRLLRLRSIELASTLALLTDVQGRPLSGGSAAAARVCSVRAHQGGVLLASTGSGDVVQLSLPHLAPGGGSGGSSGSGALVKFSSTGGGGAGGGGAARAVPSPLASLLVHGTGGAPDGEGADAPPDGAARPPRASLAAHARSQLLALGSADGTVRAWQPGARAPLSVRVMPALGGGAPPLALDPTGELLAVGLHSGAVAVLSALDLREAFR